MEQPNPQKRQKLETDSFICYFCGEIVHVERNELHSSYISVLLYTLTEEYKKTCHTCERKLEDYLDL
jgi:hypothetical protein